MIHIESPDQDISWSYATGVSDKHSEKKITADQPALIASNTKTFVAVAILKLVEFNWIKLEQPIEHLIYPNTKEQLQANGYHPNEITVIQLLSHTSGIDDYVNDAYFDFVNTHRNYRWTRDKQITLGMKVGKPLAMPGDTFRYADINFLLLTEIIERFKGKPFDQSISTLIDFKSLGMNSTWFYGLQKVPKKSTPLVHQYWNKYSWDSYDLNPSWDLFGGGGMASTTKDLAIFFRQLFTGHIIRNPLLLSQVYADVHCKTKTNYCLGIRKISMLGSEAYYHGGFWGTDAIYFPELRAAISIFILEKSERDLSADLCKEVLRVLRTTE